MCFYFTEVLPSGDMPANFKINKCLKKDNCRFINRPHSNSRYLPAAISTISLQKHDFSNKQWSTAAWNQSNTELTVPVRKRGRPKKSTELGCQSLVNVSLSLKRRGRPKKLSFTTLGKLSAAKSKVLCEKLGHLKVVSSANSISQSSAKINIPLKRGGSKKKLSFCESGNQTTAESKIVVKKHAHLKKPSFTESGSQPVGKLGTPSKRRGRPKGSRNRTPFCSKKCWISDLAQSKLPRIDNRGANVIKVQDDAQTLRKNGATRTTSEGTNCFY